MSSRISLLQIAWAALFGFPIVASGAVIFNNFNTGSGFTGTGSAQLGIQVTAAPGTPRSVTEIDIGYSNNGMGPAIGDLQVFLYANDAIGGAPGAVVWQSAVMPTVTISSMNQTVAFLVPAILVPNTFTVTTAINYLSGSFGFAPASGATTGTFVTTWVGAPGSWLAIPAAFEIETRVIAAPVPEPSTIILLALGLAVFGTLKRVSRRPHIPS